MADYRLRVHIAVEPDMHSASDPVTGAHGWTPNYLRAAGTYVEVESIGELFFDAEGKQKAIDENVFGMPGRGDWTWGPEEWDIETTPDATGSWTVPILGRPVVLLAVAGGNQVFHHWQGVGWQDQGARIELPEPAGRNEAFAVDLYAKAIFAKGPWAEVSHFQPVEDGTVNPRTRHPLPPR